MVNIDRSRFNKMYILVLGRGIWLVSVWLEIIGYGLVSFVKFEI